MNPLLKIIIILALWLLYCFALFRGCSDTLCMGCLESGVAATDTTSATYQRYPIDFQWSDTTAYTNEGFDELKQSILAGMTYANILEITGQYFEEEHPQQAAHESMGLARADQVRRLFGDAIPDDRIKLRSVLVDERPGVREGYFESVRFKWQEPEQAAIIPSVDTTFSARSVIVRFPYNSVEEIRDPDIDEYLQQLAENLKQTGRRVLLTGHTDNAGSEEYNLDLGRRRAEEVRSRLLGLGIPASQMEVETKGKSQPVAANNTEEGRQQNRRVEIRILEE